MCVEKIRGQIVLHIKKLVKNPCPPPKLVEICPETRGEIIYSSHRRTKTFFWWTGAKKVKILKSRIVYFSNEKHCFQDYYLRLQRERAHVSKSALSDVETTRNRVYFGCTWCGDDRVWSGTRKRNIEVYYGV
jgi:hypothetical protein